MGLDDRLDARLDAVEERLSRLEPAVARSIAATWEPGGAGPAAEPEPLAPLFAPVPVGEEPPDSGAEAGAPPSPARARVRHVRERALATHAAPAAKAPRAGDVERFVGVAVLGRVGIAAVLLAASWFAQLAYLELPPAGRVVSIEGLAAALMGVGFLVRRKASVRYVAILWGGATAAAYLAGVTARLRYGLVDPAGAMAMLVAACALGQALARAAKVPVLAHVALAGAFAAPLLVASPTNAPTSLLVYVLAVHAWAAWTEARFGWKGARVLALLGATTVAGAWLAQWGRFDAVTCAHVQGYLLGLSAPEWIAAPRGRWIAHSRSRLLVVTLLVRE